MTTAENLLLQLMEECDEVSQRVSKALRFTLGEVQPGQNLTNGERIQYELIDLITVVEILVEKGILPDVNSKEGNQYMAAKKAKIEKFLAYSKERGTITD